VYVVTGAMAVRTRIPLNLRQIYQRLVQQSHAVFVERNDEVLRYRSLFPLQERLGLEETTVRKKSRPTLSSIVVSKRFRKDSPTWLNKPMFLVVPSKRIISTINDRRFISSSFSTCIRTALTSRSTTRVRISAPACNNCASVLRKAHSTAYSRPRSNRLRYSANRLGSCTPFPRIIS
jgi:hypothetical protein